MLEWKNIKDETPRIKRTVIEEIEDAEETIKESAQVLLCERGKYYAGIYQETECRKDGEVFLSERYWMFNSYDNTQCDKKVEELDKWAYIE